MLQNQILLIEDNSDDITLTLKAFQDSHLANKIINISDGSEALDFCFWRGKYIERSLDEKITLIILDLKLPKVDGIEILQSLRASEKYKHQPIIVLTSSDDECDVVKSLNLGAYSFIQKPVDIDNFIKAVKELDMYWLLLNKAEPV